MSSFLLLCLKDGVSPGMSKKPVLKATVLSPRGVRSIDQLLVRRVKIMLHLILRPLK